jgi:hypothetical protein
MKGLSQVWCSSYVFVRINSHLSSSLQSGLWLWAILKVCGWVDVQPTAGPEKVPTRLN